MPFDIQEIYFEGNDYEDYGLIFYNGMGVSQFNDREISFDGYNRSFWLRGNGKLYSICNNYVEIDDEISENDIKLAKKEVENFIKPAKDSLGKPLINLQWLFDMKYKDRFEK
ncbi:hypothetical protein [Vaginisenegalia massiliensis]|uniref:hypothetical protein n=1 Tax=Vaginisenegalia massiliensis TaxID=2058294 RepID=UPI000F520BB4|nr:hypothetical protein [Vaginisenegalia massiliensis]